MRKTMKRTLAAVALILACMAAQAQGFVERCESLAVDARIDVRFDDRAVTRDDSRNVDALRRLSRGPSNPYHRVLGLTHAEPTSDWAVSIRTLGDTNGRVCAAPSLSLRLGFSTLTVYIASDIMDNCRRAIVLAHELEHVAVWRNHFRIAARLLATQLQTALARPFYFDPGQAVEASLRSLVQTQLDQQMQGLLAGIVVAHQQIDAPGSYQLEEGRMRACP